MTMTPVCDSGVHIAIRLSEPRILADKAPASALTNSILFYGRRGTLELDLCGNDSRYLGTVRPIFVSRSGESVNLPQPFEDCIMKLTAAVSCVGCRHSHLLQPNTAQSIDVVQAAIVEDAE